MTGARSQKDLRDGFERMYYILHEHRKELLTTAPNPALPTAAPSALTPYAL
jgi:hypothetical protein